MQAIIHLPKAIHSRPLLLGPPNINKENRSILLLMAGSTSLSNGRKNEVC